MSLTNGCYKIISVWDKLCAGPQVSSYAIAYSKATLNSDNDETAQKWIVDNGTIANCDETNDLLYLSHEDEAVLGDSVQLSTTDTEWTITESGSVSYGGATTPAYTIVSNDLYLDRMDLVKEDPATDLMLNEESTKTTQQFIFIPTTIKTTQLPTPASINASTRNGNDLTSINVSFACSASDYQARVRFRKSNGTNYGEWSDWMSAYDNTLGNEGWGDGVSAMFSFTNVDDDKVISVPIPSAYRVNGSTIISVETQIEIRAWQAGTDYNYHGTSMSSTFPLYYKPTILVPSAVLNGEGINISYASDLQAVGCTVKVTAFNSTYTLNGQYGGEGTILYPAKLFTEIPTGSIRVSVSISRELMTTATFTIPITNATNRIPMSMAVSESEYGTHRVSIETTNENDEVQIFLSSNENVEMKLFETNVKNIDPAYLVEAIYIDPEESEAEPEIYYLYSDDGYKLMAYTNYRVTKVYDVLSPLNGSYQAMVWIKRANGSWDARQLAIKPIKGHSFIWSWGDGDYCVLDLNTDPLVKQEDTISRGVNEYEILNREYMSYRLKKTKTRDVSVEGVVVPGHEQHGSWDDIKRLFEAGHAVFRNQRGDIFNVVVTDISGPIDEPGYTRIKVTQRVETR